MYLTLFTFLATRHYKAFVFLTLFALPAGIRSEIRLSRDSSPTLSDFPKAGTLYFVLRVNRELLGIQTKQKYCPKVQKC